MIYTAIGFDWGGVLNGKSGNYFGEGVAKLLGITQEVYLEAYFHHNKKFNRGEVTQRELWVLVLDELNQPNKVDEIIALAQVFNADNLNQDVRDLVDNLRLAGYKVGLLSNNTAEKATQLRHEGLDKHFDAFDVSAETGFVKPEPQAFYHLADSLGVDAKELVFIDDSQKSLSTSKECGFAPILFESCQQTIEDLRQLGIKI